MKIFVLIPVLAAEEPQQAVTCRMVTDVRSRITGRRVNRWYRGDSCTILRNRRGPMLRARVSADPAQGRP